MRRRSAKKIMASVKQITHIEGHEIDISCSVGISIYPDDGNGPDTLIAHADKAMYQAKQQGSYAFFHAGS